jgi:hypothetical protein
MSVAHDIVLSQLNERKVYAVADGDYTMGDFGEDGSYQYDVFTFDSLSADRVLTLPTLADNQGYIFDVINLDGSYDVEIAPEGAELINDWNYIFPITEKGGWVRIVGLSGKWLLTPLNDACIYEVSTETADTGLALDGTWDDVSGMTLLNGIYGKGYLYSFGVQYGYDSSLPYNISLYFGIGKTSGNHAPDIFGGDYNYFATILASSNSNQYLIAPRHLDKIEYESDGSPIYMKAKIFTDELSVTNHRMYGATNCPMYIKFVRKY